MLAQPKNSNLPLVAIVVLLIISSTGGGTVDPLICEDNREPKMATNKAMLLRYMFLPQSLTVI